VLSLCRRDDSYGRDVPGGGHEWRVCHLVPSVYGLLGFDQYNPVPSRESEEGFQEETRLFLNLILDRLLFAIVQVRIGFAFGYPLPDDLKHLQQSRVRDEDYSSISFDPIGHGTCPTPQGWIYL